MEPVPKEIEEFAEALGWSALEVHDHYYDDFVDGEIIKRDIRYYSSGSLDDIWFQVNERPKYAAAVYALRYRICTGWHRVYPYHSPYQQAQELAPILSFSRFSTLEGRRAFRQQFPEFASYSWTRVRKEGVPDFFDRKDAVEANRR